MADIVPSSALTLRRLQRRVSELQRGSTEFVDAARRLSHALSRYSASLDEAAPALQQARDRLEETVAFCRDCQDASALDDLDEMIRRRDALQARLQARLGKA